MTDTKYKWYVLDIIVFLAINFFALRYLTSIGAIANAFSELDWTTIIILAFGVWRITDIITHEDVTEPIRAIFGNSEKGLNGFFAALFSCNACMGVWISMISFYLFLFFPTQTFIFMIIMSLSFFERFISKIYIFLEKRG